MLTHPEPVVPVATGHELIYFRETGQFDRYMELSKQIADRSPNDFTALFQYAFSCQLNKLHEESRTIFYKILQLEIEDPNYMKSEMLKFIADTYSAQKNYKAAKDNYILAIEAYQTETPPPGRNPEVDMYISLCESCYSIDDLRGSLDAINKAISLGAASPIIYRTKAFIMQKLEMYEQAIECYTAAIQLDPNDSIYYKCRGDVYSTLEKYEEAIVDYDRAIELSPAPGLHVMQAMLFVDMKLHDKALSVLEKCFEIDPEYIHGYMAKANILEQLGQYEEADEVYDVIVKIIPEDHALWNSKGLNLINMEQYEEAIEAFTKSIELEPRLPQSFCGKGCAFHNLGRYQEALEAYNSALEVDPSYQIALEGKEVLELLLRNSLGTSVAKRRKIGEL
jgi:tetratricopeptide (TPR) repeat protein